MKSQIDEDPLLNLARSLNPEALLKLMKPRSILISCLVCVGLGLLQVAWQRSGVDPTSDFGYALVFQRGGSGFNVMSESQVAGILKSRVELLPQVHAAPLARHILTLCERYRFDPAFVLSMIQVESSFRLKVVSYAGAIGLMQLMPKTAELVAKRHGIKYAGPRSLNDPFTNLSIGLAYLYTLREKYRGESPYFHVAAYNIGPGQLDKLRSQPSFQPVGTKQYFDKIRRGVPRLRAAQQKV